MMGDMADHYAGQDLCHGEWPDESMLQDAPRVVTRASKWQTRGGQKIAIRDMTTEHLRNTLKMYEQGRLRMPVAWLVALEREEKRRA